MNVAYKVYTDGIREPMAQGKGVAKDILRKYIPRQPIVNAALSDLGRDNKVVLNDRRQGLKIVLTSTTKRAKVKSKASEFLRVELDANRKHSETHVIVAAVDKLKSSAGWHRVVCEVVANGFIYKVKSHHKGKTWTDAASHATIESKRAA